MSSSVLQMRNTRSTAAPVARRRLRIAHNALLSVTKSVMVLLFTGPLFTSHLMTLLLKSIGPARGARLGTSLKQVVNNAQLLSRRPLPLHLFLKWIVRL